MEGSLMFALVVRFDLANRPAAERYDAISARLVEQITADEAAFQFHQDAGYVQAFLAAREPLLAGCRVERLTPMLAKGLPA
jgi:quinol monooxygenase YgiN